MRRMSKKQEVAKEYVDSGLAALVGRNVRKARKEKRVSLERLGKEVGVSPVTLIRCEQGLVRTNEETIKKIAEVLECEVSEFYEDDYKGTMIVKRALTPSQRKVLEQMDEHGDEAIILAYDLVNMMMEAFKNGNKKENRNSRDCGQEADSQETPGWMDL